MKRFNLVFSIAAATLVAAPLAAQGRGRNVDGIPPGHRPPPGMCRIWIDGVPPGRQPRPTDCATAQANVPYNGRVIYGDQTYGRGGIYDRNGRIYGRNDRIYDRNRDGRIDSRDRTGSGPWYDPNRTTISRGDGTWREVGRDRDGTRIYARRRVDGNGRVYTEYARRDILGRYRVIDRRYEGDRYGRHEGYDGYGRNDRRDDDWDDDDRYDRRRTSRNSGVWYEQNARRSDVRIAKANAKAAKAHAKAVKKSKKGKNR